MKKQNCPFCGHRWIISSKETLIICPNCRMKFTEKEYLEMKALQEEEY